MKNRKSTNPFSYPSMWIETQEKNKKGFPSRYPGDTGRHPDILGGAIYDPNKGEMKIGKDRGPHYNADPGYHFSKGELKNKGSRRNIGGLTANNKRWRMYGSEDTWYIDDGPNDPQTKRRLELSKPIKFKKKGM